MKNRHLHCWLLKHLQVISNFPLYNIKYAWSSQGLLLITFKIQLSSCIKSHSSGKKKSTHKCFKLQLDILKLAAKELQSKAVTTFKPPTQIWWCVSIGGIIYDNCPQLSAPNLVSWFNLNRVLIWQWNTCYAFEFWQLTYTNEWYFTQSPADKESVRVVHSTDLLGNQQSLSHLHFLNISRTSYLINHITTSETLAKLKGKESCTTRGAYFPSPMKGKTAP